MPSFVRHASRQLDVRKQHHLGARGRDGLRHAHVRRPLLLAAFVLEAALPGLIADNTYYTYQSFDPATASVTPTEGGYQYANDVSILDGEGNATVTNVLLVCDADGNVTSMTIDGALLF